MTKKKIGVLISGNGSNLQALIDACTKADYPASISVVISNKADAYGVNRAREHGIPAHIIRHEDYATRDAFDDAMQEMLLHHSVDIICLAGFMRLLSPVFVARWRGRILNIHPSLLPQFKGATAVRDALAAGVKETGCTVHLVTDEVDAGPILLQARVPMLPGDTEESLRERIHEQEHRIYPEAVKMIIPA
ncbi:MAG: phosphoribosylglycinamide formyltransferase [Pseudomonadota bacterium]|nr:phosphoribosylglycinamide formyltransferase [Pseudomonadota bacterium]MDE3038367.1 phosphoribosylglycinamide formyltransferase [Pseudomonadota bacterium]